MDTKDSNEAGGKEKGNSQLFFCPLSNPGKKVELQWILPDSGEIRVGCDVIW